MANKSAPLRQLGENGPKVPALGFGMMGMSYNTYGSNPSDEERFELLDRAYEMGCTHWDSADLYGDSEELIGRWFKRTGKRDEIFLATKFGFVTNGGKTLEINSTGEYCKQACAASLKRLGVDCIDLYYLHHPNPKTPIEETMRALAELQKEGKIKYIGLSAVTSTTLRRALKIAPVIAVQVDYSLFALDIEGPTGTDLLKTARELKVGVIAAMPLGRGILTSTFASGESLGDSKDIRPVVMPRFLEGNRQKNVELVSQFKKLADKKGCTTAQLAIAWLLKQGDDIIPIPGTKRLKYLEENWASIEIQLTEEEEAEVRRFAESAEIAGGALPPAYEGFNFRDTVEEA